MKRKRSLARRFFGGLVLLALLAAAVLGAVYVSLNWDGLRSSASAAASGLFGGKGGLGKEKFAYEANSGNVFAGLNGGLLVVSGVETELFDGDGALLARAAGSRVSPLISAGKRNAAIWSLGGDEICLIDHKGRERYIDAGGGLVSVAVNNGGWTASVSGEEGYKGSVTVYDDGGVSVYKVFLGSGYPVDADVSPSCDSLAVLSLTEGGSRLSVYGLDDEEEKHSWVGGEVYFDVEYLTDSRLCLVSEKSVEFFGGDCAYNGGFKLAGEYLKDYTADGGFVALFLGKYRTGNQGRLVALDGAGNQTASLELNREAGKLYAEPDGRYLSAVFGDSAVIYTKALIEIGRIEDAAGIEAAIVRSDGSAIIVSSYGAAVYEPRKTD